MTTKYPDITVQLTGTDGNAFAVLGAVRSAMRGSGVPAVIIAEFFDDATSGDYDNLMQAVMRWVEVS